MASSFPSIINLIFPLTTPPPPRRLTGPTTNNWALPHPTTAGPSVLRLRRNPFRRPASPGPPSPGPEPPEPQDPIQGAGVQAVISNIQDRVQIFFAVFFWMSLFFWGSAWDGKDGSRKNKGPWFRR